MSVRSTRRLAVLMSVMFLLAGIASTTYAQSATTTANVYLVAIDDGGQSGQLFGCNDSLVPMQVQIPQSSSLEDRIAAALTELFALEEADYAASGLYNSLQRSSLSVADVTVTGGGALVLLTGTLLLGGTCDDPRGEYQIEQTVLQFPEVDGVTVLVNGNWLIPSARGPMCFNEVDDCIEDDFLFFWEDNGGLPVFGFPMSGIVVENGRAVQYFERQRFESHPELNPPYDILLGRLGYLAAEQRGLLSQPAFQPLPIGIQHPNQCIFFDATRHRVCWGFRAYWQSHGLDMGDAGTSFRESLALFGYPISEEFVEPQSGLVTQYFERAVFQWQPGNPPPWDTLLQRLGAELVDAS